MDNDEVLSVPAHFPHSFVIAFRFRFIVHQPAGTTGDTYVERLFAIPNHLSRSDKRVAQELGNRLLYARPMGNQRQFCLLRWGYLQ